MSGSSSEIQTLLNQYSQWRSFVDEVLIPLNYLENRELGGSSCLAEPEDLLLDENPDVVEDSSQGFDKVSSKVGTEDDNEDDEKNPTNSNIEPTGESIKIQNLGSCEVKEDHPEPDAQDMHWPDKLQEEPELQEEKDKEPELEGEKDEEPEHQNEKDEEEAKGPQTFENEEEPEMKEQKDYEIEPEEIKIQNETELAEEPREEIEEEPEDHNQNETPVVTQAENEDKSEKKAQDTDKKGLETEKSLKIVSQKKTL